MRRLSRKAIGDPPPRRWQFPLWGLFVFTALAAFWMWLAVFMFGRRGETAGQATYVVAFVAIPFVVMSLMTRPLVRRLKRRRDEKKLREAMSIYRHVPPPLPVKSPPLPTRYREIEVSGLPRELGRQLGEAARQEICGLCEIALNRVQRIVRVRRTTAMDVARRCIPFVEDYAPHMLEELRGTAEGAGVSLDDLMLLQIRNHLQSEDVFAAMTAESGCTSLALAAEAMEKDSAFGLVAQNWDNDPELDPFTIVLTRRPEGKPTLTTLAQAGLIGYIGFNSEGIGLCLNTLPAPQRPLGVPHYFTVRAILESSSLDEAFATVSRAERAIPANIMLNTSQGPADLEVTLDGVRVLRDEGSGRLAHTNHCLHPDLACINEQFPELIQSVPRRRRIDALLGISPPGGEAERVTIERVKTALRDHDGHPRSICRHENNDRITGYWQTVFSVIIEPAAQRMHVTRGTPCDHEYETYLMMP